MERKKGIQKRKGGDEGAEKVLSREKITSGAMIFSCKREREDSINYFFKKKKLEVKINSLCILAYITIQHNNIIIV